MTATRPDPDTDPRCDPRPTVLDVIADIGDDLDVAMVVSHNGPIVYANAPAVRLFGFESMEEILGTEIRSLAPFLQMGVWENFVAHERQTHKELPLAANAGKVHDGDKVYFMVMFRDRSEEERLHRELEEALEAARGELLEQRKLGAQVNLVKRFFDGTMALIGLTALLTFLSWLMKVDAPEDALSMFERILLVLTGMLGSAMSGIFESRKKEKD